MIGRGRVSALLALFLASGAAALIYQVLWVKELGRLFGATAQAAATTLAVFFLGLATGGWALGRRAPRIANPLRAYAGLELGIAASAGLYFVLLDLYHAIYGPLFTSFGQRAGIFLAVKLVLALAVLFPPAFLMGGTLPVMAQHLVRHADELGRRASALYAANTVGAAAGALLAGFYLPRAIGFRGSYVVAMALNVLIAVVALVWSRRGVQRPAMAATATRVDHASESVPPLVWLVAAASGLLTLALEVLWTRMYAQVLQNSVYTFAAVLTVFLLSLAAGSCLAHVLSRVARSPTRVLVWLLTLSALLVGLTPVVFHRLTAGLRPIGADLGWSAYVPHVFLLTAAVLFVPVTVIGSVFPFLMRLSQRGMTSAGRTVGRLTAVNTLAAIAGSLLAGFVLLEQLGLWASIRAMALAYAALAMLGVAALTERRAARAVPALVVAVLLLTALDPTALNRVSVDEDGSERVVEVREGSHGTVALIDRQGDLRIKVNNSYLVGTSASAANSRLMSYLPLSLHPKPDTVFYLGMGTGITAGGALDFPVSRVTVCELNPDVVEISRRHLRAHVNGLFDDSRVELIIEDGRTFLQATDRQFDVIVADIFLTYRDGIGSLYTREHFAAVRRRLRPGGLFVQWLTMFDLSEQEFGIIARTMNEVFPQVTLWRRGFSPRFPIFALVGATRDEPLGEAAWHARLGKLAARGVLPEDVWLFHIPLAAYAGNIGRARELYAGYPVSTDDRIPLEYLAPITERDSKGSRARPALAWSDLGRHCERLLDALPPERDPYLRQVEPARRDQVRAGLALYMAEALRREGRPEEAQAMWRRYEALLVPGTE